MRKRLPFVFPCCFCCVSSLPAHHLLRCAWRLYPQLKSKRQLLLLTPIRSSFLRSQHLALACESPSPTLTCGCCAVFASIMTGSKCVCVHLSLSLSLSLSLHPSLHSLLNFTAFSSMMPTPFDLHRHGNDDRKYVQRDTHRVLSFLRACNSHRCCHLHSHSPWRFVLNLPDPSLIFTWNGAAND